MRKATVGVLVICVILFAGSLVIRADSAKNDCDNTIALRDAMSQIIELAAAGADTPEAKKFFDQSQEILSGVHC